MISDEGHPRRGAALFVTLLFAALISDLTIVALRTAQSGVFAASVYLDEMRADELGRAAVDMVAYQIISPSDPDARRGGSLFAHFAISRVMIDYVSETARIDVNGAPPHLIAALFEAVGADPQSAADIARRADQRRKSARRTSGGGAAAADLLASPLARPELIMDAWNVPGPLYQAAAPALTVSSRVSRVDPTLASRLVVLALMDGDERRTDEFMDRRQRGFINAQEMAAQFPISMRSFIGPAQTQAFRGTARVVVSNRLERSYEFIILAGSGAGQVRLASWQAVPKTGSHRGL
jgi:general secretion pathway protein K